MKWLQYILHIWTRYRERGTDGLSDLLLIPALLLSIMIILTAVALGISIGYALIVAWIIMAFTLYKNGHSFKHLLRVSWKGGKTALGVMQIFLLIGWLIAMWQASGVIPMIISTGIELMSPSIFILCAFLLTAAVSMLIGTSLGTVGTVGIVLITIARAGGIPLDIAAGAIIAGAYVGDRNSPLSSSASLVASLTHTKVQSNIPVMFKDSIPALLISIAIYAVLSVLYPLTYENTYLPDTIHLLINIHWSLWLPVIIVFAFLPTGLSIRWPIGISALSAAVLAYVLQDIDALTLVTYSLTGYELPEYNPLAAIIRGGGLVSMFVPTLSIFMACALCGMLDEVGFWNTLRTRLESVRKRSGLFTSNLILACITGAIGCSQAIAVVMTHSIMRTTYAKRRIRDNDVMLDFENSGILVAALIPWNIAAMVPVIMMNVSPAGYIPFACFLYIAPLLYWWRLRRKETLHL